MNSFQRVARDYGGNESTRPEDSLLHALLAYAASDYEDSPLSSNPVRDVTMRLEARGVSAIAMGIIKQKLSSLEIAFDVGQLK